MYCSSLKLLNSAMAFGFLSGSVFFIAFSRHTVRSVVEMLVLNDSKVLVYSQVVM